MKRARALGYAAVGLCDDATTAGFHEFDEACREEGVRPIFGCRIMADGLLTSGRQFPLDFLIENEAGYRSLARILTQYHDMRERESGLPRRLSLKGKTMGLWTILPPDGELAEIVSRGEPSEIESYVKLALEYFRPQLAIGVTAQAKTESGEGETDIPQRLRELADFIEIPCLASPRFYMADPSDAPAYEILKSPSGPVERGWKPPENEHSLPCLFSESEILSHFTEGDDSPHESGEIARKCSWRPTVNRRIIPIPDFERGFDPNSYLFDLVIRGATERYGEIGDQVKSRINREFEEIKSRNLAPFLLLYRQVIQYLDKERIPRGVGRGAAVASILSYCLGITRLDPIHYRLAYQPFAGEQETYPPIRIEIPSSAAPRLIQWLKATFGENHVAQIGRRHECRREQMISELAAWAGMTDDERKMAVIEKSKRRSTGAAQRLRDEAESKHWKRWRNPAFLSDIAVRMSPRPKELAPHAGHWTLSAEPLEYVIPTVRLPGSEERMTDISAEAVDRLGGARIEFVPHHLLNLLERARACAVQTGSGDDFADIPLDDRATFDLISRGDTLGIPPLEGITLKTLLRKQRPMSILQLLKAKSDAKQGLSEAKASDLTDELPDALLSVQLAYYKTHYPEAFYAASLSSAAEMGEDPTILIREIRRAGIEILPPDINLSGPLCTVFGGKIRLGLLMVRHLGEKAMEEILSVRLGGRFNSLAEFCAGVSSRAINLRVLQNLIGAGAFDRFEQSRALMSSMVASMHRKSENENDETSHVEAQTLFDMSSLESVRTNKTELTPGAEPTWDFQTRVRKEKEALGFNLMTDPMTRFPKVIQSLSPLEPRQVTPRMTGKRLRIIGLIRQVDAAGALINGQGGLLIDLEGLAVRANATLARLGLHTLKPGNAILVLGSASYNDGSMIFEASGIWGLDDLEKQASQVGRIRLNLNGENRATLKHLVGLCKDYAGESEVEIDQYPGTKGWTYRSLARRKTLFCSPLYQGLCKILPADRIELFGQNGEPLAIATHRDAGEKNSEI